MEDFGHDRQTGGQTDGHGLVNFSRGDAQEYAYFIRWHMFPSTCYTHSAILSMLLHPFFCFYEKSGFKMHNEIIQNIMPYVILPLHLLPYHPKMLGRTIGCSLVVMFVSIYISYLYIHTYIHIWHKHPKSGKA